MFDANILMFSMLWGTIGAGYIIYARKQAATIPAVCGIVLICVSFVPSAWLMSLISISAIVATAWLAKR